MNATQTGAQQGARMAHVIGGGIVGTCCALYLQREGFEVVMLERDEPGKAASFGNAGSLGIASVPPLGMPDIPGKAIKMMFDPMHALRIKLGYLPRAVPWFLAFLKSCQTSEVERIADARTRLLERVYDSYEPLFEAARAQDLIKKPGLMAVYEKDESFERARFAYDLRRNRGIRVEEISGDQVRDMVPAIGPAAKRAYFMPDVSYVINPLRLTETLARHFVERGGKIVREEVRRFEFGPNGVSKIVTDKGTHDCQTVVVAAGVWSRELARQLGTRVLLESERGYHIMIPDAGVNVPVPFMAADRNVTFTQMELGIRMTTGAEFSGVDAPPDHAWAERLFRAGVAAIMPQMKMDKIIPWYGPRPSTPDSLPVIGKASKHANVFFAFGHGHLGLTFGAVTGRIIADLAAGRRPNQDLTPYRPDRF
ncbi:MAG: FAD-binding oxidoreductase [Proteobacteria bacterium]|nr:FAD-binding oxidoreductase [Pseudomonadota bacterium]